MFTKTEQLAQSSGIFSSSMSPPGVVLDLLQPAARKQQPGLERGWLASESEGRSLALVGDQAVAGTPAPFRSADKYSAAGEVVYVLRRCVVGALGYAGPSGDSEVALEVVHQEAEDLYLALVDGHVGDDMPEPGPGQDGCHGCVSAVEGTFQAA